MTNPEQPHMPEEGNAVGPDKTGQFELLADELNQAITNRLSIAAGEQPVGRIDHLVDEALREVAERHIDKRLRQLDPVTFASLYEQAIGISSLSGHLASIRHDQAQLLERQATLQRISYEVQAHGRLELADVPANTVLNLGLFDARLPDMAAKRYATDMASRPQHRLLRLRVADPSNGGCEVLNDQWQVPAWAKDSQRDSLVNLSQITLGSAYSGGTQSRFEAALSYGAPVSYQVGAEQPFTTPPQIIGYIETGDGHLLMDG